MNRWARGAAPSTSGSTTCAGAPGVARRQRRLDDQRARLRGVAIREVGARQLERARRIVSGAEIEPRRVVGERLGQRRDVALPLGARLVERSG